jgi:NAD(P)-dependent dehydrogenase (short-subunit alcohol dehydrogenase family)
LNGLSGKVAIVTGSSRSIGRGIAHRFAREGAKVVLNGLPDDSLERTEKELRDAGAEVVAVAADLGFAEQVDGLFDAALEAFGGVDVLVNNAGWASPESHFLELDEEHWDTVLRTNLKSVYLCSHRAANLMVDQGRRGAIVNISSFAASRSHRVMAAYDASKAGIEGFTRAIALDLAPFGIRANAVGPGAIHNEDFEKQGPEAKARRGQAVPLGRVGEPEDVAAAVAFLASDDAAYITGQVLYVDGGMLAQVRPPQIDKALPESVARRLKP